MNEKTLSNSTKKVYIRGFSLTSLLLFFFFLLVSVRGVFYFLLNWQYMSIGNIGILIVWIFIPYIFASTTFVKIYFLDNGIMIVDRILCLTRNFFYPYDDIRYLKMNGRRLEFKFKKSLSYRFLISKKYIDTVQNGMNTYLEWRDENGER